MPDRQAPSTSRSDDIDRLAEHIQARWGLVMDARRRRMMDTRLVQRLHARGFASLGAYTDFLFQPGGLEAENPFLVDTLTTRTTSFFRERAHFDFVTDTVLGQHTSSSLSQGRRLRFWSAAASSGQEAYTLAMVLEDARRQHPSLDYDILATDVSGDALRRVRDAIYSEGAIAGIPESYKTRYLLRSTSTKTQVRIIKALRQKVRIGRVNLIDERYPLSDTFDVIFLRNCLIYFDKPTQIRVIRQIARHLRPGGYLLTGHTEHFSPSEIRLSNVRPSIYRREARDAV